MLVLGPSSRAAFAGAALVAFAAAFAAAPIVARGAADVAPLPSPLSPSPAPAPVALVIPRRDPFAGGLPPLRRADPLQNESGATSQHVFPVNLVPPLPPFAAPGLPTAPGTDRVLSPGLPVQTRVTAVVTGRHPSALVDEGGSTRIVTVGDRLGDDRIVAIGLDGILLARGMLLRVAPIPGGS